MSPMRTIPAELKCLSFNRKATRYTQRKTINELYRAKNEVKSLVLE